MLENLVSTHTLAQASSHAITEVFTGTPKSSTRDHRFGIGIENDVTLVQEQAIRLTTAS